MSVLDSINRAGGAINQYQAQNPRPTSPGSNVPAQPNTPAAEPALATIGAGGSGPPPPAAPGAAPQQQAGPDLTQDGGSPDQKLNEMGVSQIEELEKSAANVANGKSQASGALGGGGDPDVEAARIADQQVKLNENLAEVGADPFKALNELKNNNLKRLQQLEKDGAITKEVHTKLKDRWKNIFNVIPKEDFGMVLMDFGLRAMMAGETMGDMAALGAAGSGALQGVQQRRDAAYQRGVEQETLAGDMARADLDAMTKAEAEGKKLPDTYNTTAGMFRINENGDLVAMEDPESGERLMPSASDRRSVKAYEVEEWKARFPGMTEQDVWLATASGLTPQQAYDRAQSDFNAWSNRQSTTGRTTLRIPGKGDVRKDELTDADIEAWKRQQVINFGYSEGALPKGGTGSGGAALGGDDGYEWKKDKPAGWTVDQWDTYVKQRQDAVGW